MCAVFRIETFVISRHFVSSISMVFGFSINVGGACVYCVYNTVLYGLHNFHTNFQGILLRLDDRFSSTHTENYIKCIENNKTVYNIKTKTNSLNLYAYQLACNPNLYHCHFCKHLVFPAENVQQNWEWINGEAEAQQKWANLWVTEKFFCLFLFLSVLFKMSLILF